MKEKYDRREDILQSMQPYMEERFQESGSSIQKKLEERGNEFWNGIHEKIERVFVQVKDLQERGQKGKIAYLVCSFMQCGVYLNRMLLRIEALDEGFIWMNRRQQTVMICSCCRMRIRGTWHSCIRK